jgi:exodeoxyribonuclease V alpha subunit
MCTPSDLIGKYVGDTESNVSRYIARAAGKVLVIDEAYALHTSCFGKTALDTLVSKVHNRPGEDIAVIMIGYEEQMKEMITKNNPDLRLFNGDVGVVVAAHEAGGPAATSPRKDAVFALGDELIRVPVTRLEDVETVHALTIHKSQGSEYGHAIVVLPERTSRLLTRELLYTGITRASKQVTIIGSRAVIEAAIRTPIRRATGLADRLTGG